MVRYFIEQPTALKRYALEFLLNACGYERVEVHDALGADIYYGNAAPAEHAVTIPDRLPDVFWCRELETADPGRPVPIDIVAATALLLSDQVNSRNADIDPHGRLNFKGSYQAQNPDAGAPIVNRYVAYLKGLLKPRFGEGLPLWPDGVRAVIGLSHDVDRLDTWSELRGTLRSGHYAVDAARSIVRNALYANGDPALFRDLLDYERSLGVTSTLMFAAISRYEAGANTNDVAYSLDDRNVRRTIEYALAHNFEIGLHASYNAYESAERFASERSRLRKASGAPVNGLRHHFWHMGSDPERTLLFHEQAGFAYDSSIAWNDEIGFRRSTALPYFPWDSAEQRSIGVLQLPVCTMDGGVFNGRTSSPEHALQQLESLVTQLVACEGIGVVDWHSDTAHPQAARYRSWGKCYWEFVRRISQTPGLWVTNLGEIAEWVAARDRKLSAAGAAAAISS